MSSTTPLKRVYLSIPEMTSLIMDYLRLKKKGIENTIEAIFEKSIPPIHFAQTTLPFVKSVKTLTFRVFKEDYVHMHSLTLGDYFINKYIIETDEGEELIDCSVAPFEGGLNILAKNIEIFIDLDYHNTKKVQLPNKLKANLLNFIIKGPSEPDFCCYDFACLLCEKASPISMDDWRTTTFFKDHQAPGDLVLLCKTIKKEPHLVVEKEHCALNLGSGLYLSVNGNGSELAVMNLKEMSKIWKTDKVFGMVPKDIESTRTYPTKKFHSIFGF